MVRKQLSWKCCLEDVVSRARAITVCSHVWPWQSYSLLISMFITMCRGWPYETRNVKPMLVWCWASVVDAGTTLNQHWLNIYCLWVNVWIDNVESIWPGRTALKILWYSIGPTSLPLARCCASVLYCGRCLGVNNNKRVWHIKNLNLYSDSLGTSREIT